MFRRGLPLTPSASRSGAALTTGALTSLDLGLRRSVHWKDAIRRGQVGWVSFMTRERDLFPRL